MPDNALHASRDALRATIARMVRREAKAITRAANNPRKFLAGVEDFYARHLPVLSEAIKPQLAAHIALTCTDIDYTAADVEAYAFDVAAKLCDAGKEQLLDVAGDATYSTLAAEGARHDGGMGGALRRPNHPSNC